MPRAWIAALALILAAVAPGPQGWHAAQAADADSHDPHAGPAMNFRRVDERLASGGHFTEGGLAHIAASGVDLIVELRPDPPRGQKRRVDAHGIEWIHVPMDWEAPTAADFEAFSRAVSARPDAHVFIQCAANFRASSMTFLHRVIHQGIPPAEARADLEAIWTPNATWQRYIDDMLAAHAD